MFLDRLAELTAGLQGPPGPRGMGVRGKQGPSGPRGPVGRLFCQLYRHAWVRCRLCMGGKGNT